jgi:CRISPR-associated endonuclease/helicase Cas3
MKFLAKSDGETIVEHTQNLLNNLLLLQEYYPYIPVDFGLLKLACQYHDLGKINQLFQEKLQTGAKHLENEIPHGLLSVTMIPVKELESDYPHEKVVALVYAVALHHERNLQVIAENDENYKNEIKKLRDIASEFDFFSIELERPLKIKKLRENYYAVDHKLTSEVEEEAKAIPIFIMIKGLLNKLDYAASGHFPIEYRPDFLEESLQNMMKRWQKNRPEANWNDMQKFALDNQNENLLIIGQTGLGKTEAGLLWAGDSKLFFTLPLKAAINAIYKRISKEIVTENIGQRVGLLHSDSLAVLLDNFSNDGDEEPNNQNFKNMEAYLKQTKSWSLPITLTTLDQTFDFVYHYTGFEMKLATFSYSKIIIDEIQMYSPDLLAYLIKGLSEIQQYGGKFLIMTATMPDYLLQLFSKNSIKFKQNSLPFLSQKLNTRHYMKVEKKELFAEDIINIYKHGKLLVVCNTIKQARKIYDGINGKLDVPVKLLHSQFIRHDRQKKEQEIFDFTDAENTDSGIWIATQVVEASLDIDFDLLITELSELNGLLQRMGRCYRKRSYCLEVPNVYVFNGGRKSTSGISKGDHAVVHEEIFELAKTALGEWNGLINEQEKMDLIKNTYSIENMENTEYYKRIENTIKYLNDIDEDDKSKKEVQKLFRNINSKAVIPKPVFDENKAIIENAIVTLQNYQFSSTEERKIARIKLDSLTLSLQEYILKECNKRNQIEVIKVNRFTSLLILDAEYNKNDGLTLKKAEPEFTDNFF